MFLLLMAAAVLPGDPGMDPSARDQAAIQGTWSVVAMEVAGKTWEKASLEEAKIRVVIQENKMGFQIKGKETQSATFKLDASKKQPTIDTIDASGRAEQGIYELKGDDLRICTAVVGGDRPTEFASKATPPTALFVLKREKP